MLFRIAFMVDEKDVGPVYAKLKGVKMFNVEPPMPVQIADDRPYTEIISLEGLKTISSSQIKDQIEKAGKPRTGYHYAVKVLRDAGMLRPTAGVRGVFDVVKRNVPNGKAAQPAKKGSKRK